MSETITKTEIKEQIEKLLGTNKPISVVEVSGKPAIHMKICRQLNDIYTRKNHDYGDSFAKVREKVPNAILVRILDKTERLTQLLQGADQQVKDESIDDTLLDLANYCIMELVERKIDSDKKSSIVTGLDTTKI